MDLKFAFSHNPRIEPLLDGSVPIEGVEASWRLGHPADLHLSHLTKNNCDVFEFSISNYMIQRTRFPDSDRTWTALPIFLLKALMWLRLYVNEDSGIETLADLRGKRVGLPDFQMTAAIWMRIVLRHLYDIGPEDVHWFNGRTAADTHGAGVTDTLNPAIQLTRLEKGGGIAGMLERGEIDVAYGDNSTVPVQEGGKVRLLFGPGEGAQVIADFQRKTGVSPINHILLMQRSLADQHPDLPMRLFHAFERSKQEAYARARRGAEGYLLFPEEDFARQAAIFGEDPFPSGLAANRAMLEMVADEEMREGLVQSPPDIPSLFAPSTLTT